MEMEKVRRLIEKAGVPGRDAYDLPTSTKRFPDGSWYRMEISGIERPNVLEAMIDEMKKRQVPIHRAISVVMGATLLDRVELHDLAQMAAEAGLEVILSPGPRVGLGHRAAGGTPEGGCSGLRFRGLGPARVCHNRHHARHRARVSGLSGHRRGPAVASAAAQAERRYSGGRDLQGLHLCRSRLSGRRQAAAVAWRGHVQPGWRSVVAAVGLHPAGGGHPAGPAHLPYRFVRRLQPILRCSRNGPAVRALLFQDRAWAGLCGRARRAVQALGTTRRRWRPGRAKRSSTPKSSTSWSRRTSRRGRMSSLGTPDLAIPKP